VPGGIPALDGFTDTVPDIVGRLGVPIDLAIFTEGNHFPVLLGGEIIVPFRSWARRQPRYAALALDNIVVVTLPQSMIVAILLGGGLALGNMTLAVSRASGFYPDIVMSGAAPLARLRQAAVVAGEARVFARNRGLSLLVAAGNPLAIRGWPMLRGPAPASCWRAKPKEGRATHISRRSRRCSAGSPLRRSSPAKPLPSQAASASSIATCCRRSPPARPMSASSSTISRVILPRPIRMIAPWSQYLAPTGSLRQ
jgi:hypothetical protein